MKKAYYAPTAEKISFNYKDQVVASGNQCGGTRKEYTNRKAVDNCAYFEEGIMNAG